jgi:hypothetical protein
MLDVQYVVEAGKSKRNIKSYVRALCSSVLIAICNNNFKDYGV